MIDGFRYGFFAQSDVNPWLSLGVLALAFVVTALIAVNLLARGFKLRN
jgi:ABC-2 type transport system permease protein